MTPKVKLFQNVFPDSVRGHRTTFHDQIWWKLAVAKLPKGPLDYDTKNLRSAGLVPAPILPKMGHLCPKFPERCHPLTCHWYRIWFGSAALCQFYYRKIDFWAPKVITISALSVQLTDGVVVWCRQEARAALIGWWSRLLRLCQKFLMSLKWSSCRQSGLSHVMLLSMLCQLLLSIVFVPRLARCFPLADCFCTTYSNSFLCMFVGHCAWNFHVNILLWWDFWHQCFVRRYVS